MLELIKHWPLGVCVLLIAASACAEDIVIHLPANTTVERHTVTMQCDTTAVKLGVPEAPFSVEYINASPIALAVLPLGGKPLVFAGVISGSGARYAAGRYIWWDAGRRGITLSTPSGSREDRGSCHVAPEKQRR